MPLGFGVLEERSGVRDSRVGEHHVEPSVLRHDTVDEGLDLSCLAHVDAHREGAAAAGHDLLGHRLGAVDVDVAEGDGGALGREEERGGAPDAERAARDRRHASGQAGHASPQLFTRSGTMRKATRSPGMARPFQSRSTRG